MSATTHHSDRQILVTGGAGFIGSHSVDRLLTAGYRVIVLDNFSTGQRANLARWLDDPRLEIVVADIADGLFEPLAEVTQRRGPIDRILHLAAQVSVDYSIRHPLEDIRINYAGVAQALEYARCCGVRKVVFASSAAVYGDAADLPARENAGCKPLSPYGVNKLGAEYLLSYYSAVQGAPTTALRFFNVYGPRQDPASAYSGVISIFMKQALAGETLTIFGDGRQSRDFVYVGDVARAAVTACCSDAADGAVVNIGAGQATDIATLARLIVALCGSSSAIRHRPARPGDILHSLAAVECAEALLGFRAEVGLEDGLRATLEWFRQAQSLIVQDLRKIPD